MGLIKKAIGLVTSALGINGRENADYQNAFSEEMLRLQRDWQLQDRDYNNLYNTPSMQMERWRAAGINPFMAMGNMDAGSSTMQSSPSSVASADPTNTQIGSLVDSLISNAIQAPVSRATAKNLNSSSALTDLKIEEQRIINQHKAQEIEQNLENMRRQGRLTWEQFQTQRLSNRLQLETYDDTVSKVRAESRLVNAEARAQDAVAEQESYRKSIVEELLKQETFNTEHQAEKFVSDLDVNTSQIRANNASAEKALKEAEEAVARKHGIELDNSTKEQLSTYIVRQQQAKTKEDEARAFVEDMSKTFKVEENRHKRHGLGVSGAFLDWMDDADETSNKAMKKLKKKLRKEGELNKGKKNGFTTTW